MRTVFILLFLVLIGFGFLLSDNINTHAEIAQMRQQNNQLDHEKKALQAQLDSALVKLAQSEQSLRDLAQQNLLNEQTIRQLNDEITAQKEQIANLERKVETLKMITPIQASLPDPSSLMIFLPVIPASIAATYMLVRYNKNHAQRKDMKKAAPRNTWVKLTDDEIKEIVKLRREQQ